MSLLRDATDACSVKMLDVEAFLHSLFLSDTCNAVCPWLLPLATNLHGAHVYLKVK